MKAKIGSRLVASLRPKAARYEVWDTELPGLLLRVETSGRMVYFVRYRLDTGRRGRAKIGDAAVLSPVQARDLARSALADLSSKGIDPAEKKRSARAHTLRTFLDDEYGPWLLANRKSGRGMLSDLKSACKPLLDRKLADINVWVVEKWRSEYAKAGHVVAGNRYLAYLKSCLSRAVEWGHLTEHPIRKVKAAKVDTKAKVRYLSPDEERSLMDSLNIREERIRKERDNHNAFCRERGYSEWPDLRAVTFADYLKPMVLLSLNTGMRRGEVMSLEQSDVNLKTSMLTIQGDKAKSGATRHVPLNSMAAETLKAWQSQTSGAGLVFLSKDGKPFKRLDGSWDAVLKQAKIENFRWHDMRHDFASKLVMAGVDLNTVRELLGHSDLKMTLRYAHLAPKVKADAVERLVQRPQDNLIPFPQTAAKEIGQ